MSSPLTISLAALVLGLAGSAMAQEAPAQPTAPAGEAAATAQNMSQGAPAPDAAVRPTISFNAAVTSDYIFRGVSQTLEDPAVQGGVDVAWRQLYAGAWASNVDFGTGDHAEVDLYAGFKPVVAGWTVDAGAIAYLYPGQDEGADETYVEAKLGVSRSFDRFSVGATAFWSPDFFGPEEEATYIQGDLAYKVADRLTVSGSVGRQWVSSNADYATWNAGGTFALTDRLGVDLRYYDTDAHGLGDVYGARVVGAIKASF
jgi:uncharacterized protein (TIGR02001 family)